MTHYPFLILLEHAAGYADYCFRFNCGLAGRYPMSAESHNAERLFCLTLRLDCAPSRGEL